MRLDEILTTNAPFEVVQSTAKKFITRAKIGDRFIQFIAFDDGEQGWDITFEELVAPDDKRPSYRKTGSGEQFKVFSMVAASFREFLDRYQPVMITFTAEKEGGDNRARMYRKLTDKYLKGWDATEIDGGSAIHFTYYRIDPPSSD